MDSPVRLQLKRNDYLRHKLFRKINRRRRAKRQLDIEAPVKELKKRLRLKRTFEDGKDGDVITNTRGESYRIDPDLPMYNDDGTLNAVIDNINIYSPRGYREAYERRVNNMLLHTENPLTGYAPGLKLTFPEFDLIGLAPLVKPIVNAGLRSAGRMISKAVENHRYPLGRPQVPKDYITISPKTRTKIGDVEIDNPELAYRQGGKDMIEDFIDNGIVRGIDSRHIWGEAYANNPMFQHGSLFSKELSPGLLVSNGKTKAADVLSRPISEEAALKGGITFRIPDEPFTLANTQAYIFEPNYGYRRVLAEETPSLNWADATRTPQITAENAASITPKQWTAAQDAAIARGDMAEAQRLRDLHFKVSAPNNTVVDNAGLPVHVYHGTSAKPFTIFDINASRVHDLGTYGKGFYFTPNKKTAINYGNGKHVFDSYLKLEKPYSGNMDVVDNVGNFRNLKELKNYYKQEGIPEKELNAVDWGNFDVADGVNAGDEIMVLRPNQIKSADAITYDNNGVRIPLGERDNFNINDIRYGLLPLGIGLTGYSLSNYANGKDSGIYIKPQNRGKFTRLKKRTGHSTAWFKAHGTPAQKKMATFAQNAKKWHH